MTSRFAIIGQPVTQSMSPRIHPQFAAQFGIELQYERVEVAPADLKSELARLHAEGYAGLNVTAPHKAGAAAACTEVSERVGFAGAANTLVRTDAGWAGHNTDGEGLIRDLDRLGVVLKGRRVLLLGAGGAARGVLEPLLSRQPAELTLSNRSPWKPEELATQFKAIGHIRPCTHYALKGDRYDVILNATSAGHQDKFPRLPEGLLAAGGICYDLTYGKAHAPFATWASAQNAALIADGLGMLVEQAAAAFELWFGKRPETEAVMRELRG